MVEKKCFAMFCQLVIFSGVHLALNVKCTSILTFLNVLTPKISLIHKNNHICNIHTLGDLNNVVSCYPTFPYTTLHKYSELPPCMLILAVSRLILSVGMIQIVLFQIAMSV